MEENGITRPGFLDIYKGVSRRISKERETYGRKKGDVCLCALLYRGAVEDALILLVQKNYFVTFYEEMDIEERR